VSKQYQALSIVAPSAERIVQGSKTLEIRSWQPETLPLKNLVIVENLNFLTKDGDEEMGRAVALVDIEVVRSWQAHEVEIACASYWAEGYLAWVISNVRPFARPLDTIAKRKLYRIELML
jgi:hypothetical protein